ncbi:hypothetical protein Calab_0695 [Caldithrix abyssi DSM 13497]|uniref:Por secretion system C-terminal sorting domain-containing protein n=1 Tax=Caldithrix abyssi DSM 13497 TaxID=880073 RepID=H1XSV8_CALAY|nr:T9SS type A sorting domain-containing protein [Caldithrix abyssi]APF20286.1 Por secretion system C-terminal sorting domain-containing protein [Caldithrix abyssi DSM 13497]EHO40335.1 hypothetical protein Calab_0695 [Caldithrix abyssi DSM 13497]
MRTTIIFFSMILTSLLFAQKYEFEDSLRVTDGIVQDTIVFGTNYNGTDGYDSGLDLYAPPKPPSGFDARFTWDGEDYRKDIRLAGSESERVSHEYVVQYQASADGEAIKLYWNKDYLKSLGGSFKIISEHDQADTVDMTLVDSLDTASHWDYEDELRILYESPIPSSIKKYPNIIVESYFLMDIFPNPFNPITNIKLDVKKACKIKIDLFTNDGKYLKTLKNEYYIPGVYNLKLNRNNLSSGIYFIRSSAKKYIITKKIVLIK